MTQRAWLCRANHPVLPLALLLHDHPGAFAGRAVILGGEFQPALGAPCRLGQGNLNFRLQVRGFLLLRRKVIGFVRTKAGPATPGSAASAKEAGEEIAEVLSPAASTGCASRGATLPGIALAQVLLGRTALPVRSQFVVFFAFLRIPEHLVGLVDLLETLLGVFIAGVDVRMVLAGQLAIGGLDFLLAGG